MFSDPQDVEVYEQGAWWPGSVLGWRHDDSGACEMRVRLVVGDVEETAWVPLVQLRLPQPPPGDAGGGAPGRKSAGADGGGADAPDGPVAVTGAPVLHEADATRSFSAVRVPGSSAVSARHRLPPVRQHASRPAPGRPGPSGSRRSAEDRAVPGAEPCLQPAAARIPAPAERSPEPAARRGADAVPPAAAPPSSVPVGRHRAPGRHRAADTGVWTLSEQDMGRDGDGPLESRADRRIEDRAGRPEERTGRFEAGSAAAEHGQGGELLTRPLQLRGPMPEGRRARWDGLLSGV